MDEHHEQRGNYESDETIDPVVSGGVIAANAALADAPIRPVQEINLAQVELGKKLYFDPRLAKSGFISCNSCHNLSMGGTETVRLVRRQG